MEGSRECWHGVQNLEIPFAGSMLRDENKKLPVHASARYLPRGVPNMLTCPYGKRIEWIVREL
jgi:hypothetical protein